MDTSETRIMWLAEIQKLKESGALLCPLMLREPEHFKPALTVCDIPKTREHFLATRGSPCHSTERCLPRIEDAFRGKLQEEIKEMRP